MKESERKMSKLEPMEGANKWRASLVITVCVFGLALKLGQEDGGPTSCSESLEEEPASTSPDPV